MPSPAHSVRPRPVLGASPFVVVAAVVAILAGCASAPRAGRVDPYGPVPEDLVVEVVVRAGADREAEAERVEDRSSRLVVLPDGGLLAGPADGPPPRVRQLDRGALAGLWLAMRDMGFADPTAGEPPSNDRLLAPAADEVIVRVRCRAGDEAWAFTRSAPGGSTLDPATVRLVRLLAGLAWLDDEPHQPAVLRPRRYDLGPDPWGEG